MEYIRENVVMIMQKWVGKKVSDGSHKEIIDIYNTIKPLPRGYKMTYTAAWCAATVSAAFHAVGYDSIFPFECSCSKIIDGAKTRGIWQENDAFVPSPGDCVIYDWEDDGNGDNTGAPNHVGMVESVSGKTITVIEGNYGDAVKRRKISVNGKYIRGFVTPKFSAAKKPTVLEWQLAAKRDGYKFPKYGADGEWGAECEGVAKKAVVKKRLIYTNKELTKIVQRVVGVTVDGKCGNDTQAAIKTWQKAHGLTADGAVGINSWKKMLGV